MATPIYPNRQHASRALATRRRAYAGRAGVHVPALPRGGVPAAFEAAQALRAPLGVQLAHTPGVPGHSERHRYDDCSQTGDDHVRALLARAASPPTETPL